MTRPIPKSLPVDDQIPEILTQLREVPNLVISAAPGTGKTTRVPPALLHATDKQIWILEPRRMAAVAAASRVAEEGGWRLGEEVGYQVRFDNRQSSKTRILFLTEALLARRILHDPMLENVGIVILDEFHERSLHVDLALGLLRELQQLSRPDLKIIVMSATLDADPLLAYLDPCELIDIPGKTFELRLQKAKQSQVLRTDQAFIQKIVEQICEVRTDDSILVFLPGRSEIERVKRSIEEKAWSKGRLILPLMGQLKLEEQLRALRESEIPKLVLSTNVAESSVTVEGVRVVIDSGLARISRPHPRTDFPQLVTARISKASAKQRAGRAARQGPGVCYQLWAPSDELSMPEFEAPEVQVQDLTEAVLFLFHCGLSDPMSFSWFEFPSAKAIGKAVEWLKKAGAIQDSKITEIGKRLARIPTHPRLGRLLIAADDMGIGFFGAALVGVLQEISAAPHESVYDQTNLILQGKTFGGEQERAIRVATQLQSLVANRVPGDTNRVPGATIPDKQNSLKSLVPVSQFEEILLQSFPDRLCRRRDPKGETARMVGGRGVSAHPSFGEYFVALDVQELDGSSDSVVRRAVPIDIRTIHKVFGSQITSRSNIIFDQENEKFYFEESAYLWDLPLGSPGRKLATSEQVETHLPEITLKNWDSVLRKNDALRDWLLRWKHFETNSNLEPYWDQSRLARAVTSACYGEISLAAVSAKNLITFFELEVPGDLLKSFYAQYPSDIVVPSGSRIRIHYPPGQPAFIEVRLQELFGLSTTPTIADGKIKLSLHLLGPNYRPVQITNSIESFWQNTYPEVRKELRSRYPKHSWPDDPTTAVPQAKGRPRTY